MTRSSEAKQPSRILIVEDSRAQAENLRYVLENEGYSVDSAGDGVAALQAIAEQKPDLVITDVNMPSMDGYELCRRIKQDPGTAQVPVMLLTALSDPADVIRGLECGADSFTVKPFEERSLLTRVSYMLLNRHLLEADRVGMGLEIVFDGNKYMINSDRLQILNLLLSSYQEAVEQGRALLKAQGELEEWNRRLEQKVNERTEALRLEVLERRAAEEALRRNEQNLRVAIASVDIALFRQDRELKYTWLLYSKSDLSHEDMLGKEDADMMSSEDAKVLTALKEEVLETGRAMHSTIEITVASGEKRHYYIVVEPEQNGAGEIVGLTGSSLDITERRLLEQTLQHSQKMEAIGQLTGGVAHDFNNLLGAILGNLDLLELSVADDEKLMSHVMTAQKAAMRGADLTKRLLAFSRRQQLDPKAVSLNECVQETLEMADRTLGPKVNIKTHLEEALPSVLMDSSGFENVLLNLMINSRDSMPNGGTIYIATKALQLDDSRAEVLSQDVSPGDYACVSVTDTGCGMSKEVLEKACEPFFTTKERGKGTGLGLAMIYGFVKQSKGHMNIYSEEGHGTTVRIYLPFANAGSIPEPKATVKTNANLEGTTVLVVDDEADLLDVAAAYLEEMGCRVLKASNADQALALSTPGMKLDLLITDVIMPGTMNGIDLGREICKRFPAIKVIYSTGFASKALSDRSGLHVPGRILSKPYRRTDFRAMVSETLGNLTH